MNDSTRLAQDLLSVGSKLISNPPTQHRATTEAAAPVYHKENSIVGVDLQDYTTREPSEDGTYVKVIVHKERIELIEQPPTPEEIAQRKEDQKQALKLFAIVAGGAVASVVVLGAADVIKAKVRGS